MVTAPFKDAHVSLSLLFVYKYILQNDIDGIQIDIWLAGS